MSLKQSLYHWANRLGLVGAVRDSAWRQRRLLILCYHGISQLDEHEWNPALYLSPTMFRARMQILADEGYTVLPLGLALQKLYSGNLPSRSVALTFDDGTVDFAQQAVPILQEFCFPATVYLTTYYSNRSLPVFDGALAYVLWRGRKAVIDLESLVGSRRQLSLDTEANRESALKAIHKLVSRERYSAREKDALLRRVASSIDVNYQELVRRQIIHIMPPEMVRALPRDLIDVQLHTHRHRTPRDKVLFSRELTDNRTELETLLGPDTRYQHFCYPSGDYDGLFLDWLADVGVVSATTCIPGIVDRGTTPLLLPRFVDTATQSPDAFKAWASGFAALLPSRREHRLDRRRLGVSDQSPATLPDLKPAR